MVTVKNTVSFGTSKPLRRPRKDTPAMIKKVTCINGLHLQ